MYMESIVAAKAPVSATQRRVAGSLLVLLSVVMMLPWLTVMAIYPATTFGLRAMIALPATLIQAIDHAGDRALGR